jgi:hypothetical protein
MKVGEPVKGKSDEKAFKMLPSNIKRLFKEIDFNKLPDENIHDKFMAIVFDVDSFVIFLDALDNYHRTSKVFKYFALLHRVLFYKYEGYHKVFENLVKVAEEFQPEPVRTGKPLRSAMEYNKKHCSKWEPVGRPLIKKGTCTKVL